MITRTRTGHLASTAAVLVLIASLSGCADSATMFSDRREARFYDASDLHSADSGPGGAAMPIDSDVVPADATAIAAAWHTDDDEAMLTFTSPTGIDCPAGALSGEPALEANWWPSTHPADGMVCDRWQVFRSGETWYLYTG